MTFFQTTAARLESLPWVKPKRRHSYQHVRPRCILRRAGKAWSNWRTAAVTSSDAPRTWAAVSADRLRRRRETIKNCRSVHQQRMKTSSSGSLDRKRRCCNATAKQSSLQRLLARSRISASDCTSFLHPNHSHQLLHRRRALFQPSLLIGTKLDLDDLLDPLRAQLHRHSYKQALDPILTFQIRRAWQNFLFIF